MARDRTLDRLNRAAPSRLRARQAAQSAEVSATAAGAPCPRDTGGFDPLIEPAPGDKRFADPAWSQWPFNLFAQSFLSTEAWWTEATHHVPGLVDSREAEVAFMTRALIDVVSPSNIPWLNPVIINKTAQEGGFNLVRGAATCQWT